MCIYTNLLNLSGDAEVIYDMMPCRLMYNNLTIQKHLLPLYSGLKRFHSSPSYIQWIP